MSTKKRGPVGYTFVCSGLEEAYLLREKVQRYEAALAAIATLEYVYLRDWDASVEAGISDARDIAQLALDAEKDAERTGSDTIRNRTNDKPDWDLPDPGQLSP